jgi:hypothetical protein
MVLTYSDATDAPGKGTRSPTSSRALVAIVAEEVPDGISAEDRAAGLGSSLTSLAAYVER